MKGSGGMEMQCELIVCGVGVGVVVLVIHISTVCLLPSLIALSDQQRVMYE